MFRNIKFLAIFLLFFCFIPNELRAEEILTWEDCLKEAKKNHPDLISAKEKLNQAKASKAVTASSLLPQISSSASAKTSRTEDEDRTETYSYSAAGKQLVFDGFKTCHDLNAALENVKSAQYSYNVTSSNVRLRLKTAFVELLKAQELLNITEDIAHRRKQNLELVKLRYEAGREHKGSLLTAQANLAQAEFEVAQAWRNLDLAQRKICKEMGRTKLIPARVKGDFEIKYFDKEKPDFDNLAENTPLLQELIAKREAAGFNLKSAKADFFPEVYANASAGRTGSEWLPDTHEWSVSGSLSLPIFEGGNRFAQVSKNKFAFNQARADERSGKDSVLLTLEETWKELQDAIGKVEVQQKFLEAAIERAKIAQAQYSTGLVSFDNWTIIEDDLVKAKKSFLDVQSSALISDARWIQAKGETLDYE